MTIDEAHCLDRLLALARGASRRHEEALKELDRAEREKRTAWETYDMEYAAVRSVPNRQTETKGESMFKPLKDGLCITCGRDARNHDFGGACRPGSAMEDLAGQS